MSTRRIYPIFAAPCCVDFGGPNMLTLESLIDKKSRGSCAEEANTFLLFGQLTHKFAPYCLELCNPRGTKMCVIHLCGCSNTRANYASCPPLEHLFESWQLVDSCPFSGDELQKALKGSR